MRNENPIHTLGDYSRQSHEGYQNTIELHDGNNVVPLRSDTIWKRTRVRLFQFSLRDQASNWLERLLAGSISTWEDLTTRFLAQFFPLGRTYKLRNDILMFQQHQEPSELDVVEPIELAKRKEGMEDEMDDESDENMKEELTEWETKAKVLAEMPRSQPIGYYLKHEINEKLIEGLIGIAEDVLIDIAGYVYLVDFVILNIKEDENKPFILGTPFLTTTKAEIRFDKGTITLKSDKNRINFFQIPEFQR
ncbi:zinc finger, CCHC-type containing protein [Tanacetum coccineum]